MATQQAAEPALYTYSVPGWIKSLRLLKKILQKGESFCQHNKFDASKFMTARLYLNMMPLWFHVTMACNTPRLACVRVADVACEEWNDRIMSFEEFYKRIDDTLAFLEAVKPEAFEGKEDKEVLLIQPMNSRFPFTGKTYMQEYAHANFYFHFSIAYAILRNNGVPLGKYDVVGYPGYRGQTDWERPTEGPLPPEEFIRPFCYCNDPKPEPKREEEPAAPEAAAQA